MARYFITFKPNSSLAGKVMVITGLTKQTVNDLINREYSKAVEMIYDEQTFASVMPAVYSCTDQWVAYGTECVFTERNCDGKSTAEFLYPVSKHTEPYQAHSVSVADITKWFKTAKPYPTTSDLFTQLGAMYEEVAESVSALNNQLIEEHASDMKLATLHTKIQNAKLALEDLASALYKSEGFLLSDKTKIELLDALADITVTTTGSAQYAGFDFDKALTNVNQSNWSKFEDGKPVLNEDDKIMKGKDYFKPELSKFI